MSRNNNRNWFGIILSFGFFLIIFFVQLIIVNIYPGLHITLRHLYYIPIIFGAYIVGVPGGIIFALVSSFGSFYHTSMMGQIDPLDSSLQVFIFFSIGLLIGFLSDSERNKTITLEKSRLSFLVALSNVLDKRDTYTEGHSIRVAEIAKKIGLKLRLKRKEIEALYQAGLLHDIGKIGIPDSILKKDSALTIEERNIIREHCIIGELVLKDVEVLNDLIPAIKHHHERYDGLGYPSEIAHDAIPLFARILCVADSFDAMTSQRSYNKSKSHSDALIELEKCSGSQFDPKIVSHFKTIMNKGLLD